MKSLLPLLAVLCFVDVVATAETKPNILWLSTEDIGPHLGCYGDSVAKTPTLDNLAKMGMRYQTAWSTYPVCAPARTTIISGMYPASTGGGHMRSSRPLPKSILMFPRYLREAGYYCTNNSKEDYNHPKTGKVWDESSRRAHYRKRKEGQPFFAVFNVTMTHESRIRSKPHKLITDPKSIKVPSYYPNIYEVRRDWAQYYDNIARMDGWIKGKLDELRKSGEWDNTIIIFFGDHGSGMPRHKRYPGDSGLRVPLIVHVPEKLKHLAPKNYKPGAVSKRLVGFVDFAATVLSIAGVKTPAHMHGKAFLGKHITADPQYMYGFRGRMDERPDLVRSIRDQRYVYIRNYMPYRPHGQHVAYQFQTTTTRKWKQLYDAGKLNKAQAAFWETRPAEELYDLQADPDGVKNLAGSEEHAKTLARFRSEHRRKTMEIRDVAFLPEGTLEGVGQKGAPHEFGKDKSRYPLEKIFDMADIATRRDANSIDKLLAGLADKNATVRYWAATGFLVRGKATVIAHRNTLVKSLEDASPPVRVVVAEALATYTDKGDLEKSLQALAKLADLRNGSYFTAVAALNAIDNLGDRAEPILESLKNIKTTDPNVGRAKTYIQRLVQTINGK